jgi:hypothetical protein
VFRSLQTKAEGTTRACAGFNGAAGALVRKVTGSEVRRSLLRAASPLQWQSYFLQVLPRVRSTSPSRDVSRHHVNGWNHSGLGHRHLCIAGSIARLTWLVTASIRCGDSSPASSLGDARAAYSESVDRSLFN